MNISRRSYANRSAPYWKYGTMIGILASLPWILTLFMVNFSSFDLPRWMVSFVIFTQPVATYVYAGTQIGAASDSERLLGYLLGGSVAIATYAFLGMTIGALYGKAKRSP